jgi:hypothetical protein
MQFRLDPMGKGGKTESLGTILDLCSCSVRISYKSYPASHDDWDLIRNQIIHS